MQKYRGQPTVLCGTGSLIVYLWCFTTQFKSHDAYLGLYGISQVFPPCLLQMLEAELLYRQCASDARIHQEELVKVKEKIISHMRKLICQGDNVLKEVGVESRKLNIWPSASSINMWYINRGCVVGMEWLYLSYKINVWIHWIWIFFIFICTKSNTQKYQSPKHVWFHSSRSMKYSLWNQWKSVKNAQTHNIINPGSAPILNRFFPVPSCILPLSFEVNLSSIFA